MNKTTAKLIRKLLEIKPSDEGYRERTWETVGEKYVGIIDGVGGNHRIETRDRKELRRNPSRMIYNKLKKVYKTKQPKDVYDELMDDLALLKGGHYE